MPAEKDIRIDVDPWHHLRRLTRARIALGHSGGSQTTDAHLAFQLAHATARDAVHTVLDREALARGVDRLGLGCCLVDSEASDRTTYLTRPDLGRRLSSESVKKLEQIQTTHDKPGPDLAIVLADGLSARAVQDHGLPVLEQLRALAEEQRWSLAPVVIARQARVALGDDIGERLKARMLVMLIGERPGLSSPDSLGAYLTCGPRRGLHDDARNCISNIRPEGLGYGAAGFRLGALLKAASSRGVSGVTLKDDSEPVPILQGKTEIGDFLTNASGEAASGQGD